MPTIAVDLDGVLHSYERGWQGGELYGTLVPGAREAWETLTARGFELVVLTSRDDLWAVQVWLSKQLDRPVGEIRVTNRKIPAIAYIDDRGLRFTNWPDMVKYFA